MGGVYFLHSTHTTYLYEKTLVGSGSPVARAHPEHGDLCLHRAEQRAFGFWPRGGRDDHQCARPRILLASPIEERKGLTGTHAWLRHGRRAVDTTADLGLFSRHGRSARHGRNII